MTGIGGVSTAEALRRRRSCRDYLDEPIPADTLATVLAASLRAPAAGNAFATELIVLQGEDRDGYWDVTLPAGARRDGFRWPGLLRAPLLVIPVVRPETYLERYAEADKAHAGLGNSVADWDVPYWFVDGGAAIMAVLIAAAAHGLGSLLFGQFGHAAAVAQRFAIPADRQALGTIALGLAAPARTGGTGGSVSQSARRGRPALDSVVHHGRWHSDA